MFPRLPEWYIGTAFYMDEGMLRIYRPKLPRLPEHGMLIFRSSSHLVSISEESVAFSPSAMLADSSDHDSSTDTDYSSSDELSQSTTSDSDSEREADTEDPPLPHSPVLHSEPESANVVSEDNRPPAAFEGSNEATASASLLQLARQAPSAQIENNEIDWITPPTSASRRKLN